MLNPFVRDSSYFQIVRNSNELITGYVFDNQFSNLADYINNKILPTVDNLVGNKINGILDSDGYLLRNIGDRSTQFSRIRANDINDGIIDLDRFKKIPPVSILYCNTVNLGFLRYTTINTTLINVADNCFFGKIKTTNIENSTITNDKIALGTLNQTHLDPLLLNYTINGVLANSKILDQNLTSAKIADKAFTEAKMSTELLNLRNPDPDTFILVDDTVTGIASDAHIIKTNNILDNSISFHNMFGETPVLSNANIAPNSITLPINNDISPYSFFNNLNLCSPAYIKDNSFKVRNVSAANGLSKYKLSEEILVKLRIGGLTGI